MGIKPKYDNIVKEIPLKGINNRKKEEII